MPEQHEQDAEIKMLIQTIDDDPDRLHLDHTASVQRLIELGLPAAMAVLDLLNATDSLTRLRAQRVLEGVVMQLHGWTPGRGYADSEGQGKTLSLLKANGDYQADAPPRKRRKAIEKWQRWLEVQMK
ncbi:MAG TPA: hypothetical protein VE135_15115 [Pyrinomonadaceae bacterium]|nr:hypothetical protein [Pyrinomonadaceae bacterium]